MSAACGVCHFTEGFSVGKWYVCPGRIDSRLSPALMRDICVNDGMVTLGAARHPRAMFAFPLRVLDIVTRSFPNTSLAVTD